MQDIFDQAGAAQPKSAGSDIFDQASQPAAPAPAAAPAAPQAPPRPAGLPAGVDLPPGLPAHAPAPYMRAPSLLPPLTTDPKIAEAYQNISQNQQDSAKAFTEQAIAGPKQLVQGIKQVYSTQPGEETTGSGGGERGAYGQQHPQTAPQQAAAKQNALSGAANVVSGAGQTLLTADGPGIAETGLAALGGEGANAARIGLAKLVAGFAAGSVAEHIADKAAAKLGFGSGARDLVDAASFWLPGMAGELFGLHGAAGTVDGKTGAGATVLGGKASVGGYASPEEFAAGVRVGDTQFNVRVPRKPPTDPASVTAKDMLDQGIQTVKEGQAAEAAAGPIVNGATPQQAVEAQGPKQPAPPGMDQGELSADTVAKAANLIRLVPEADRAQAVMEAHGKLADWMAKQGRFVGPDGQITIVKTPEQAQQLAAKLINEEVGKHDEAVAAAQAPPAEEPKGKSKLQKGAEDRNYQRAKTLLDSNPEHADPTALVGRNLGMDAASAAAMVDRYKADKAANVGSSAERVVEEKPATVDAQMDALRAGTIKAVMLPEGSGYEPKLGPGMKKVVVSGDAPGAGTYIIKGISPETVKEAAKAGTHGDLLGHVQDKEQLAAEGKPTVAVVASKPDGTEIQASEVNNLDAAHAQAAVLAERHPDAKIEMKPIDDVIAQRTEPDPAKPEGDVFDQITPEKTEKGDSGQSPEQPKPEVSTTPEKAPAETGRVADRPEESPTPAPSKSTEVAYEPGERIAGHDGYETKINTEKENYPAIYRLVELDDVTPSHDGNTFEANAKYPKSVQEHDYTEIEAKNRVYTQEQKFDPSYLITDNPGPENGPPMIVPDGMVLGGNSRINTLQRVYKANGEKAAAYRKLLTEKAPNYGPFTSEQVSKMRRPALVRELTSPPSTLDALERIGSALNKSMMGALTPQEKAVSTGRKITPAAMDEISRLIDKTGENASIRSMMAEHGIEALKVLEDSGVLTNREAGAYKDISNPKLPVLSEAGKDFIENALIGSLVGNAKLMKATPASILNKLESALGAIASLSTKHDEYDLVFAIRDSLDQHAEVAKRGTTIEAFQKQGGLLEQRTINPVVDAIAAKLADKPTAVKKALRAFAGDAKDFRQGQGQLIGAGKQPFESFNEWFGSKLTEQEYRHGIARAVSEEEPRTAESRSSESSEGGSLGEAGRGEAARPGSPDERGLAKPAEVGTPAAPAADRPTDKDGWLIPRVGDAVERNHNGTEVTGKVVAAGPKRLGVKVKEGGTFAPKDHLILSTAGWHVKGDKSSNEVAKPEVDAPKLDVPRTDSAPEKTVYKFGNTQAHIPKGSEADRAITALRAEVSDADLAGDGKNIDENHVTVRYGIRGDNVDAIREFLRTQAPFDASVGAVASFPPSENSDGAAVLQVPVESSELHRINAEIEKHGDFEPSSFPEYKPHITVAYVKPSSANKYVGMTGADGTSFRVDSIAISKKDGTKEEVKLEGKPSDVSTSSTGSADVSKPEPETNTSKGALTVLKNHATGKWNLNGRMDDESLRRTSNLRGWDTPADAIAAAKDAGFTAELPKNTLPIQVTQHMNGKWNVTGHVNDIYGITQPNAGFDSEAAARGALKALGKTPDVVTPYTGPTQEEFVRQAIERDAKRAAETLPERLYGEMSAGRMPKDNIALKKLVSDFDGKPADPARLKQAQEAMEEALVRRAREIVGENLSERPTFQKLLDLYESQPNLNVRTTTSIENQAYSTPAPLAFLAGKLAGITRETKVYEPTAGNGMLVIGADPKNIYANELNGDRAGALGRQKFHTTQEDASKGVPAGVPKVDAVITNPPFGSVKGPDGKTAKVPVDGYKIGQIDHLIAARALDAMKDDGRATLILGANKVAGGLNTDDRIFFNWLYSHYRVASHFELDGKLYARQGAGWPVRVIVIDGRVRSGQFSPVEGEIARLNTWKEVYVRFNDSLAAIKPRQTSAGISGSVRGPSDAPGELQNTAGAAPEGVDRGGPGGSKTPANRQPRAQPEPLPGSDVESAAGLASTDNDVRPDADVSRSDRLAKGETDKPAAKRDAGPARTGRSDLADADNAFQVQYKPASSKQDKGVLIPTNMRDPLTQAMRALEDRVGDIDKFAAKELGYESTDDLHNALMGLQVDSVAAAIDQMSRGKAIVIADQTGIGKGRQAAAIIRYAERNGKIPVFMSVKPTLFTDMFGDLADIGTDNIAPLIVNVDESISLPNDTTVFSNSKGQHRAVLEKVRNSGNLPEGRNALFLTYSQVNTANLQRELLGAISHKSIFVLDESHNAAGDSSTGEFMQGLLGNAHGVVFLSATYAKRPDNMALYARTDMGIAIKDKAKLEQAMAMGGLPLQTVVSNNLVKAGQMFRRERSYDGVNIEEVVAKARSKQHRELADKVTEALRGITSADRAFHRIFLPKMQKEAIKTGQAVSGGGNKASASVTHTEFSSVVHNSVRQLLMGLKADDTIERAIASIKAGEKPVIAVEQTMGSFLQEYAADNNIQDGDSLGDFTYRTVLNRALTRSRALMVKDSMGNVTKVPVSLKELDDETRIRYHRAQGIIDKLDADIPMSPIDWMRQGLKNAGYSIAEITGRKLAVDYSDPKNPKLTSVPEAELSSAGKVETTRRFNDGRLDAILLNVAGSTGISLHASEKFKDQRQRKMIVAQPAQDINIFMQMLGRVHRTGQVQTPNYDILAVDLPAEKRPNALLSKKMKSLNANTSSNTESATSVKAQDMLNKYGDEIVNNYLIENPALARELNVKPGGDGDKAPEDIARVATGRLAIMPVAVQEAFYNDVEQSYATQIDYLNDTNQNDLEPRTFDYEAKELKTSVLSKGTNHDSPFGQDAIYGEYSIKPQAKPITVEDVKASMAKNLGGKTAEAHTEAMLESLQSQFEAWHASLDAALPSTATAAIVRASTVNFIKGHAIGSTLRLSVVGEEFSAAVTNIESTHKGTGNPFSMSKINVTVATTGPQPNFKVSATQLMRITTHRMHQTAASIFADFHPSGRETAKIITGNLLGAYGELQDTKGTIINFTREDGSVEQGILLPKKFELSANTVGDHMLETPAQAVKFIRSYPKPDEMALIGIASRDGDVRVTLGKSGQLVIQTPKSKVRGAKYFLDRNITEITGDFVSSGQTMKAIIPAGKEAAALGVLMKKTSLYASRSMAATAESILSKPAGSGSVTLNSSLFGADVAAKALGRVVKVAWDKDIAPHLPGMGENIKEASASIVNTLVPTFRANRDVLDSLMKLKGDQERALFHVDHAFAGIESMFDGLPEMERIDFLDRYKRGEDQQSPELDKIAAMYKALDTATYEKIVDSQVGAMDRASRNVWERMSKVDREAFYDELTTSRSFEQSGDRDLARDMTATVDERKDARKRLTLQRIADGVLSFKENHLRAFWKVIPGTLEEKSTARGRKSPLRGDRGFTKRSTLPDVSSGIADGGVLETTNPQKLVEMGQKSAQRYITALNMWKEIGDLGMRKFVPMGERAPDGWETIDDAIAKVFFPVRILTDDFSKLPNMVDKAELGTRSAVIQGGEWYVEQSAARLLNNYLSKSWFQTNSIGRGLMQFKNLSTGFELALSPFHAVFESIEAMGSQMGVGLMHSWNTGMRQADGTAFLEGLKHMATAPAAPVTMAMLGGKAIKMEKAGFAAFAADPVNQQFLKSFPEATHLVDLLFTGGITMAQPREYRVDLMENAKAAMKDGNYLGALARAVPGISKEIMKPMFEKWIPRLKMGFALQALSQQLGENHDALVRGDITEAEIARSVVDSAENRFGELNFSNLWWNNTFKGVNQLMFRSVTWKLGNWRGATMGVAGQAKAFADPIKTMYEDAKGERKGADRKASEYVPKLDLNMSWLIGMGITTVVLGTILSKLKSGKYPWEWAADDKKQGMSEPGALLTEFTHPRTGSADGYTGLPTRVSLPTGARDFEHAFSDPRGYLHGSLSGFAGKMWDTWDNRDFASNYIYDPNGTAYQKLAQILKYNEPANIGYSQFKKGKDTKDWSTFEMGLLGLSKASTRLDMSPLERHMEDIRRAKKIPQTPEEKQAYTEKMAEVMDGGLSGKERRQALKEFNKPYLLRLFSKLNYVEAKKAMTLATPEEQHLLHAALMRKRKTALERGPRSAVLHADNGD